MMFRLAVQCNNGGTGDIDTGRENYCRGSAVTTILGGRNNRRTRGGNTDTTFILRNSKRELSSKDVGVIYHIYRTPMADIIRFVFFVSSFDKSPFIPGRTAAAHVRRRHLYYMYARRILTCAAHNKSIVLGSADRRGYNSHGRRRDNTTIENTPIYP